MIWLYGIVFGHGANATDAEVIQQPVAARKLKHSGTPNTGSALQSIHTNPECLQIARLRPGDREIKWLRDEMFLCGAALR